MNRGELRTELQQTGFGNTVSEVTRQNHWLDQAYLWVWHARDPQGVQINWSFKKADQTTLAVTGGSATPTMPTDFGAAEWIEDDQGSRLEEMSPDSFDEVFAPVVAAGQSSTRAWAYKVVNRQVTFGPTPVASASYRWTYTRRVSHLNQNSAVLSGTLSTDSDQPLWPDHHMVLVYAAALHGHAMNSNPFGAAFAQLRDDALQAMRADLEEEFAPAQVWGDGGWSGYGG